MGAARGCGGDRFGRFAADGLFGRGEARANWRTARGEAIGGRPRGFGFFGFGFEALAFFFHFLGFVPALGLLALGVVDFGGARFEEPFDFFIGERAELADGEAARGDFSGDGDAVEIADDVADAGHDAADLAIFAFGDADFEDGAATFAPEDFELEAFGADGVLFLPATFRAEPHPFFDSFEIGGAHAAIDFDDVGFFDAEARVGEAVGEFAVVGHDERAAGFHIEPADGEDAFLEAGHEFADGFAVGGVIVGDEDAFGFIEEVVDFGLLAQAAGFDGFFVDGDDIARGVDHDGHFGEDGAVHADAAAGDHGFTLAPGGDAAVGEETLEANFHRVLLVLTFILGGGEAGFEPGGGGDGANGGAGYVSRNEEGVAAGKCGGAEAVAGDDALAFEDDPDGGGTRREGALVFFVERDAVDGEVVAGGEAGGAAAGELGVLLSGRGVGDGEVDTAHGLFDVEGAGLAVGAEAVPVEDAEGGVAGGLDFSGEDASAEGVNGAAA